MKYNENGFDFSRAERNFEISFPFQRFRKEDECNFKQ
jgi:hypothetical protein